MMYFARQAGSAKTMQIFVGMSTPVPDNLKKKIISLNPTVNKLFIVS